MLAPGGAADEIGSTLSQMPKIRITTIPETTSGITTADRPTTLSTRSSGLPTLSAATTPPMIPSGTTRMKATAASLSELPSALVSRGPIAAWYWYELPGLPVTKLVIHVQYCSITGLSVPSWCDSDLTAEGAASGPRIARAGSPGRI